MKKEVTTYEELRRRNRIATKKWREAHPERYREYAKMYREKHKDKIKERQAQYRLANGITPRNMKPKEPSKSADQLSSIFKNPIAAWHYKWLTDNNNKLKAKGKS